MVIQNLGKTGEGELEPEEILSSGTAGEANDRCCSVNANSGSRALGLNIGRCALRNNQRTLRW
jgi:hypothetical protein